MSTKIQKPPLSFTESKCNAIDLHGCLLVADFCNFSLCPEKSFPLWSPGKGKAVEDQVQV